MLESNCCGAEDQWDMGICSDCGEHAEFDTYSEEEDNKEQITVKDILTALEKYERIIRIDQ
jgi:predicted ATP-dependent serine protease